MNHSAKQTLATMRDMLLSKLLSCELSVAKFPSMQQFYT